MDNSSSVLKKQCTESGLNSSTMRIQILTSTYGTDVCHLYHLIEVM